MIIESGSSPGSEDCFYLTDLPGLSKRDRSWDKHRYAAEQVEQLYSKTEFTQYAARISRCSELLDYAFKANDSGEVALRLQSAWFCRVPQCPVCNWRRSLMWKARFFKAIPKILDEYPSARFLFLTFTIRNCELTDLRDTFARMNKAWKLLTMRKEFPGLGYVKTSEVTRAWDCYHKGKFIFRTGRKRIEQWEKENKKKLDLRPTTEVNPHLHVILMVRNSYFKKGYLSKEKWYKLWQNCLKIDYEPWVDIKALPPLKQSDSSELDEAMVDVLCETLKYTVKESDLTVDDPQWLEELTKQLYKIRKISLGGVFKQYLSEDDEEDLLNTDSSTDEPVSDDNERVRFYYNKIAHRYKKY